MVQRGVLLKDIVSRIHKYLLAHRSFHEDMIKAGMLPAYTAGFIAIDKQFCTVGINGMLESYEYLKQLHSVSSYDGYLIKNLQTISSMNKEALKKYKVRFNTEFVPAENLAAQIDSY